MFAYYSVSTTSEETQAMYEYRILFPRLGSIAIRRELDVDAPRDIDRRRRGECLRPARQPRRERA
jgi:hypothetical protein